MDGFTFEIGLTLILVGLILIAFLREWAPPDVIALTSLAAVVVFGLIPMDRMSEVFKNEAPLTIAALFVIGGALESSGAVDLLGKLLRKRIKGGTRSAIFSFSVVTAFCSAWMNNTAVVAILLPVVLGFARSKDIAAGRLLMPLSYSSILGGCCTLIGTSTNLLANGVLTGMGEKALSMFELAPVGIPLAIAGIIFLTIFGPKLIANRASAASELTPESRSAKMYHVLVSSSSDLIGTRWIESPMAAAEAGIHVVEIRRDGHRITAGLDEIIIERFDRYLVTVHGGNAGGPERLFASLSLEIISEVKGLVTELVIESDSSLAGRSMAEANFRQHYNAVVLAIHRNGNNITSQLGSLVIEPGDTLLVVTPAFNLGELKASKDFILTDAPARSTPLRPAAAWLAGSALVGAVMVSTLTDLLSGPFPFIPKIPIHFSTFVGALILLWSRTLTPRQAYQSIDWQVLFMLYGLLGLGMAMQTTGTAAFLADFLARSAIGWVPPDVLPYVLLWAVFLLTLLLTEVLSNNATAVMMIPIVVPLAQSIGVETRPFVMAVVLASSLAFALPMGYQTHLMVYGPGGFRFKDFLKVGIPMNFICWGVACLLIPLIWPFAV
ncbi:SLC13 family permease [Haloferula chungangensis]|uniref:SLC13 family permease n=1 Tax=Haloferula chungangensis TaxID=1048331 RepID=A0ABW2L239_9BACT